MTTDINTKITQGFSRTMTNSGGDDPGTGTGTGNDPGTGGDTGWWDYVPWDQIGNNLDGLFGWLGTNNGANGAPYYQQNQTSTTTMLMYAGGGFLLIMVMMVLLLKLAK